MRINLLVVYRSLCTDLGLTSSDTTYVLSRLSAEGVRFVTSTLPALSKAVLHAVEIGNFYEAIKSLNFTHIARKGRSLRYFRSLLGNIFDLETGDLLTAPSGDSLLKLRTLCEYAYKLNLPFEEKQLTEFTKKFVHNDENVFSVHSAESDLPYLSGLRAEIERYYGKPLGEDPMRVLTMFPPRPGSGTFSGASGSWYMWKHTPSPYRYRRFINGVFLGKIRIPFSDRRKIHPCSARDAGAYGSRIAPHEEAPSYSELLFVPKDSRGPRTIVREPRDSLLFQMSFHDWFSETVQKRSAGRIQFVDQSINNNIAQRSSVDGSYATIDLKDASDNVSYDLVSFLFRNIPSVMFFLRNFRTSSVKLPDGKFHGLRKLSGMGSGFTFPIMAFVCHSTIAYSISKVSGISFSKAVKQVYVYGDDICVPTRHYSVAIRALRKVGFSVNDQKSYHRGPFRESCGGDYLSGYNVTPCRLRLQNSEASADGFFVVTAKRDETLVQLAEHTKELTLRGLVRLRAYYERLVSQHVRHYPYCSNFEFSGIVRYRSGVCYVPCLSTGNYPTTKVYTYRPVRAALTQQSFEMNSKLHRGYDPLEVNPGRDSTKVAVPRKGMLRVSRVSSLCLTDETLLGAVPKTLFG